MPRPDPAQRHHLVEIRDNLIARITEAEQEGWPGEIDGLQVSLASTEEKLTQLDAEQVRQRQVIGLGAPRTGPRGTLYGRRASKWVSRKPRSDAGSWSNRANVTRPAPASNSANCSAGQL
jgi:hypothetical protein